MSTTETPAAISFLDQTPYTEKVRCIFEIAEHIASHYKRPLTPECLLLALLKEEQALDPNPPSLDMRVLFPAVEQANTYLTQRLVNAVHYQPDMPQTPPQERIKRVVDIAKKVKELTSQKHLDSFSLLYGIMYERDSSPAISALWSCRFQKQDVLLKLVDRIE